MAAGAAAATAALAVIVAQRSSPAVPVAAVAAAALFVAAAWRPLWVLLLAVGLMPVEMLYGIPAIAGITPMEATLLLLAVAWCMRQLVAARPPVSLRSPLAAPLAVLLVLACGGGLLAQDGGAVLKAVIFWSVLLVVHEIIVDDGRATTVRRLLFVLVLAGGGAGAIALAQAGGGAGPELVGTGAQATGRAGFGTFAGGPNTLAMFLALALAPALALALAARPALRPAALGSAALVVAGLTLSLSRGGLLAAGAALVVLVLWAPFRRAAIATAVVLAMAALAGLPTLEVIPQVGTVTQRLASLGEARDEDPRLQIWRDALRSIEERPLLGVGANNDFGPAPAGLQQTRLVGGAEHAHSTPLTVAVQLGVPALVVLAWLVVVVVRSLLAAARRRGEKRGLAFAVGASVAALALHGLVDYTLSANVIATAAMVLGSSAVVLAGATAVPGDECRQPSIRAMPRSP